MNANMVHNFLNAALVVIGAIATMDLSVFLSPDVAVQVMAVLGAVKLAISGFRDGLKGMVKVQPPVIK